MPSFNTSGNTLKSSHLTSRLTQRCSVPSHISSSQLRLSCGGVVDPQPLMQHTFRASTIGKHSSPLLIFGCQDSLVMLSDSYYPWVSQLISFPLFSFGLLLGAGSASCFHPSCLSHLHQYMLHSHVHIVLL